ncbi:MAG: CDP-alcohol phosphatidyltransferase family protein [Candidatus Latescibacterota bacterium]|nr:CDP-alcohol phosphatidyltransferase family protein [Candidatus Latescibacterota bacterium]
MEEYETAPLLWIDATRPASGWQLWGMTLVERQLRQARLEGVVRAVVAVVAETRGAATAWRSDLSRIYDITVEIVEISSGQTSLASLCRLDAKSILAIEGDVLYDDRILNLLFAGGDDEMVGDEQGAAARLSADSVRRLDPQAPSLASACAAVLPSVPVSQLDTYVADLRLTMAPIRVRLTERSQLREVDHLLYHRTFKGVIDIVASHGYYRLVRGITRWLSRTSLTPNFFTVISILGIWIAVPCFTVGSLWAGVIAAWIGVIFDSVDGKLARLTLQLSDTMGTVEHLTAVPGLGLWFVALGWHFSGGEILDLTRTPALACWVLVLCFVMDKMLSGLFKFIVGSELFDFACIDALFHGIAARRNIHLLMLTVGVTLSLAEQAYVAMAIAMVLTMLFHTVRVGWILAVSHRP